TDRRRNQTPGNRSKDGPLFARLDGETSGIVRGSQSGSRVRRRDRGAYAPAHRAICSPGDDRGRGRPGRAPPVWECDMAGGGQSGYAWNNIYRDIHSRLALWRANAAENTRLYADYRHYPGARHWREHGDFEYGEWLPAARAGR